MDRYPDSYPPQKGKNLGQIAPPADHASHRKTNSYPRRRPNADLRTREYLTEGEVERLLRATKGNRWGHRDGTMILMAHPHGFRAAELVDLRWDQIDFEQAALAVRRVKKGSPATTHPILGDELRRLRRLQSSKSQNHR